MPRPLWSGAISFGLVTIPVKMASATEDHSVHFHQYHVADGGRVRIRKYCETEYRPVSEGEIGKGYEIAQDQLVAVTDAELEQMPLPTAKAIEIVAFVPLQSIDPVRLSGDSYLLQYDGQVAAKPYALLGQALARTSKVAVAKLAWHNRERLVLLRVKDRALLIHVMHWDDEIRDPAQLAPKQVTVPDREIDEAVQLIDSMTTDDLSEYTDNYREALHALIEAKAEGKRLPPAASEEAPPGTVLDLMAALQESVRKAQESRGEQLGDVHDHPTKKAVKKTAAKRTATKKSATKKTTEKVPAKRPGKHSA